MNADERRFRCRFLSAFIGVHRRLRLFCPALLLALLTGCAHLPPASTAGTLAFVANSQDNSVSVIDLERMKLSATLSVAQEPVALASVRDRIWVLSRGAGTLQAIDVSSLKVTATVRTGREPFAMVLSEDGSRAWIANRSGRSITVVDLRTARAAGTINLDA